jgi:hypothetical protein
LTSHPEKIIITEDILRFGRIRRREDGVEILLLGSCMVLMRRGLLHPALQPAVKQWDRLEQELG